MASVHDCGASVGTLAAAVTSFTVCYDSSIWTCKDRKFDAKVGAISAAAFLGVNAFQHKMPKGLVDASHMIVGILPSILYLNRELRSCSARGEKYTDSAKRFAQNVRMLPIVLLPLMVYFIAANEGLHDVICSNLHKMEFSDGAKTSGMAVDLNAVRARARDAIHAAETSLRNAGNQVAAATPDYSYDLSL